MEAMMKSDQELEALLELVSSARRMYRDGAHDAAGLMRAVAELRGAEIVLEGARRALIGEARAAGAKWYEIGSWFGVSAQAAQQRFGRRAA